jgi:hypothetical protein
MQVQTSMRRLVIAVITAALLSSCTAAPLRPATSKLAHWTTTLREQQPEDSFAAVYRVGDRQLIFVGARHEDRVDSPTFRMIADAYAGFDIDHVIVEGVPTSRGPNPKTIIDYASREPRDGRLEGGELAAAVLGALKEGAHFRGGEPEDAELKTRLLAQAIPQEDVLGFYVLRSIPQWIREQKVKDAGDPRLRDLVQAELARSRTRLGLGSAVLPGYDMWARWYGDLNGRPIGSAFITEEVGPLYDGRFPSNKVAYAISRARGAHLHELIIAQLAAGDSVLVVFGGSHLMIQRPALDAALGHPCYTGSNLRDGAARCG